ncbi:MAG: Na+/H+ antiporter NhaC [Verrucomicrobiota bacterium]
MPNTPDPSKHMDVRLWHALIPVVALVGLIAVTLLKFEGEAHIPLVLASAVAVVVGLAIGHTWETIENGILRGIQIGMKAILILCVIGVMIGTWIAAGVVPILIYYGLQILSPGIFLVAACLICAVVSLATGSSWTTASTVGIALMGVATGLNVPPAMAAGAVISGAYFGDKMSPLSDSTNLAPAVAGSELFEHIRHMLFTTVPALMISLVLYAILGMRGFEGSVDTGQVDAITSALGQQFQLSPILLLPPMFVIAMVFFRWQALPALLLAALLGGVLAVWIQGVGVGEVFNIAHYGFTSETGNEAVDALLTHGGLDSMMNTVSLILCALTFGGVMESAGMLGILAGSILKLAKSTGSLVAATVATCVGMNILAPDQYLSIIVPGRMYREEYHKRGLHPKNLSRTLEDAGTLSSPLVAWNSCGAFMAGTLAVSPMAYLPYAFLNWLTPIVAIFLAYTGWTIVRLKGEKDH